MVARNAKEPPGGIVPVAACQMYHDVPPPPGGYLHCNMGFGGIKCGATLYMISWLACPSIGIFLGQPGERHLNGCCIFIAADKPPS